MNSATTPKEYCEYIKEELLFHYCFHWGLEPQIGLLLLYLLIGEQLIFL